jgi:hypothetical protein
VPQYSRILLPYASCLVLVYSWSVWWFRWAKLVISWAIDIFNPPDQTHMSHKSIESSGCGRVAAGTAEEWSSVEITAETLLSRIRVIQESGFHPIACTNLVESRLSSVSSLLARIMGESAGWIQKITHLPEQKDKNSTSQLLGTGVPRRWAGEGNSLLVRWFFSRCCTPYIVIVNPVVSHNFSKPAQIPPISCPRALSYPPESPSPHLTQSSLNWKSWKVIM